MEKILLARLERLRCKMNILADRNGIDHPDVLAISQRIDQLHNLINRLQFDSSSNHQHSIYKLRRSMKINESRKEVCAYLFEASANLA